MKIRTKCPSHNKYYIRRVTGGLNDAVAGEPTQRYANVLDNCVGYANGRFNESINDPDLKGVVKAFKYQLVCNAENFIESAKRQGLKISSTPIEGGVMVWQKGRTLSSGDGAGHVAFVERVYDDGSIMTSESGWDSWAFKTVRRDNSNGRWGQNANYKFRGCIINPSIKNPKVVPVPPLVIDGIGGTCTVRATQRFFGTPQDGVISGQNRSLNKCYPALTAVEYGKGGSPCVKKLQKWVGTTQDGVLGEKTIKAWQKKLGVKVDGVFGVNSMKAWQKYLNEHKKAKYPTAQALTKPEKAVEWAKKIAADDSFHYVVYGKDKRTHLCPVCHGYTGLLKGFNCIRFVFSAWFHAGIKCKHEGGLINNAIGQKMYTASDAEMLRLAQDAIGCKDIKVFRNKNGFSDSQLQVGDACMHFENGVYKHIYLYAGNGMMVDSGNWSDTAKQIAVRKRQSCQIIIRYTGK